jgi:hypothetical protein
MVVQKSIAATAKTRKKEAADAACIEEYNLKTEDYKRSISRRRSIFDLRTEAMRTDKGNPRQGRLYNEMHGAKEGGLKVDEMIYGIKMAHLSCTDDTEDRLVGSSPNALAALEHAVGGPTPEITMRKPLSEILKERYNLNLDCWMDYSGFVKGRPIDTQGFIASNDETIVLSYRFSTTLYDWIANLSLTSSEWLLDKDEERGHAGRWSSCGGWFTKMCRPSKSRPRVHTAYYNNFIYVRSQKRKIIALWNLVAVIFAWFGCPNIGCEKTKTHIVLCLFLSFTLIFILMRVNTNGISVITILFNLFLCSHCTATSNLRFLSISSDDSHDPETHHRTIAEAGRIGRTRQAKENLCRWLFPWCSGFPDRTLLHPGRALRETQRP